MDNKRLAIFFALSAAILIGWSILFPPPKPAPKPRGVPAAAPTTAAQLSPAPTPEAEPARPAEPVEAVVAEEEKVVTVASDLYEAKLSNRGGALVSFVLKRFKDGRGKPLDLVRHGAPYPGRTLVLDAVDTFTSRAANALHHVESETKGLVTEVRFRYRESTGEEIVRTYAFGPGYVSKLRIERGGRKDAPVAVLLGPTIGNPSGDDLKNVFTTPGSYVYLSPEEGREGKAKESVKEPTDLGKGLTIVGLEDNYFLTAFLPAANATVQVRPRKFDVKDPDGKPVSQPELDVALSGTGSLSTDLFFGPKHIEVLRTVRPGMEKLIDYGWFAVLVRPLLWGLRAIQGFAGNWGVAIIIITFLIKLLLYPLTHQQLVSMKRMAAVQPKLEAIRTKYAAKIRQDPQARMKMNEEVMGVYRTEKINPASGCFPLLLQMPILIAFYRMLQNSIELRHAPFVLWIQDLSVKDPYYVTPILMTLTMWFQQATTPQMGDPTQRKIMAMMPFVFGFLFKDAPSGLVLYWLVQNILTIVQQAILNRYTDLGPSSLVAAKK